MLMQVTSITAFFCQQILQVIFCVFDFFLIIFVCVFFTYEYHANHHMGHGCTPFSGQGMGRSIMDYRCQDQPNLVITGMEFNALSLMMKAILK